MGRPKKENPTLRVSLNLNPPKEDITFWQNVRMIARKEGVSLHVLVRRAVETVYADDMRRIESYFGSYGTDPHQDKESGVTDEHSPTTQQSGKTAS